MSKLKIKHATAKQCEAELAFQSMQNRLDALPKFASRYPTSVKRGPRKTGPKDKERQLILQRVKDARESPSLVTTENQTGNALAPRYHGELALREARARSVRHVVAPIANKMGYGLITNPDDLKTMGRKV
jgi:hypothetical protein